MVKARNILIYFAQKYDYTGVLGALRNKEKLQMDNFVAEECITIIDDTYPDEFKILPYPPIVIWATDEQDEKYSHDTKSRDAKEYYKKLTGKELEGYV